MNTIDPLNSIRHFVTDSLKQIGCRSANSDRPATARALRFENLEERRVLSVTLPTSDSGSGEDSGYVTSDQDPAGFDLQQETISHLRVLVNGEERGLTPQDNHLDLEVGDSIEVIEIGFTSSESAGVFAAEGYLNKINDLTSASLIDYNDGRFSDSSRDHAANGGNGVVAGLNDTWTAEAGWDRMTISLMHYTADSIDVAARFLVNMRVSQPDFAFDTDYLDTILEQRIQVGDEVDIPARWLNRLEGNFHNYAEVDIYHASAPDTIVWAGAVAGNASLENDVEGTFINTRDDDPFTEKWTPLKPGEYILKYTADPEHVVLESDEANNLYQIRLSVEAQELEKEFSVPTTVSGAEDTPIELNIASDYEKIEISGVPKHATLSEGTKISRGTYEVSQDQLDGLSITAPENSDVDFSLTVTPFVGEERLDNFAKTVDVVVEAVVDGGDVNFRSFGIQTTHQGKMPVSAKFFDLDGSESHQIKLTGLPEYLSLSAGTRDGSTWTLDSSMLAGLRIEAAYVDDTSGWDHFRGHFAYTTIKIETSVESFEMNGSDSLVQTGGFQIVVWQRTDQRRG